MKENALSFLRHYNATSESLDKHALILDQLIYGFRNAHRSTHYFRRLVQLERLERRVKKTCTNLVTIILKGKRQASGWSVSAAEWETLVTNACQLVSKEISIIVDAGRQLTGLLTMHFWLTFSTVFFTTIATIYQHRAETMRELKALWKNLPDNSGAVPSWDRVYSLNRRTDLSLEEYWTKRKSIVTVSAKGSSFTNEEKLLANEVMPLGEEEKARISGFLESEDESSTEGEETSPQSPCIEGSVAGENQPQAERDDLSNWLDEFEDL